MESQRLTAKRISNSQRTTVPAVLHLLRDLYLSLRMKNTLLLQNAADVQVTPKAATRAFYKRFKQLYECCHKCVFTDI
jgi:hypothetical protein